MNVRAKMRCVSVSRDQQTTVVRMEPVVSGSAENAEWSRWTPSGELRLGITNDKPAAGAFTPGAEYLVDITPAPAAAE